MYINVYFRRVLHFLGGWPPGLRTRCADGLTTQGRRRTGSAGQAASRPESAARAVTVPIYLQPCSGWLAVHGCWLAACMQFCKTEI